MTKIRYIALKRYFDVIVSLSGIIILLPLFILLAVFIYYEDRGSVLFRQNRVGKYRVAFSVIKFRSMKDNKNTRIGAWMRATGIDELPQLVNVLKNEMSLVGPRPLTEDDIGRLGWNEYRYQYRWDMSPGMTGLAQLYAGGGARMSTYMDRIYYKKQSFIFDLWIIFYSFVVNIIGKRRVRNFLRGSSIKNIY